MSACHEFYFNVMLCSNLGNENSDAGHIKCSRGRILPAGSRFPTPAVNFVALDIAQFTKKLIILLRTILYNAQDSS